MCILYTYSCVIGLQPKPEPPPGHTSRLQVDMMRLEALQPAFFLASRGSINMATWTPKVDVPRGSNVVPFWL